MTVFLIGLFLFATSQHLSEISSPVCHLVVAAVVVLLQSVATAKPEPTNTEMR